MSAEITASAKPAQAREPLHVKCTKCSHIWAVAYMPMEMGKFSKVVGSAHCPMCGAGPKELVMSDTPPADSPRPLPVLEEHLAAWPGLAEWLASGARGSSSNTIVQHLTGIVATDSFLTHPYDPADLRRCRLLLEAVPTLVANFGRMAELTWQWKSLVQHWDELCSLMDQECPNWRRSRCTAQRTYERMRELLEADRKGNGRR